MIGIGVVTVCAENIDPDNDDSQYAYGENVGYLNFEPGGKGGSGAEVTNSAVTGYVWGENIGWINLSPKSYGGVENDGAGNLSGYAWGENVGWINFAEKGEVTIGKDGVFDGWVWGENIGWIHLKNLAIPYKVKTAWAPPSTTPTPTPTVVASPSPEPTSTYAPTPKPVVSPSPIPSPTESPTAVTPPAPIIVTATPVVVNNGSGNQVDPHVDGNLVAYTNAANGVSTIRYFNFSNDVDLGIPGVSGALDFLPDVSGATVVFTRIEGARQSIWSFNTTTSGPAIEMGTSSATSLRRGAYIGGNTVAWQELGFSTSTSVLSEVMAYDLTTSTGLRLTNDTQFDRNMSVAPNGNVIVWDKCLTSNSPCDIWQAVKGSAGWTVSQVTSTADSESFADTNGTLVVYGGVRAASATSADIYWKPVAGGAESQLALVGEQRNPNISENVIAFEGRDLADASPNWDIYLYDLSTSTLYRLTNTPALHETLNDISVVGTQVRVVWSVFETDQNVYSTTFAFPVANAGSGQAVHSGNVVTLDGSASSDLDTNYPLSYSWTITSKPEGSAATLSDPAVVNPSFTADLPGDYVIRLVVADSSGFVSAADSVTISTTNTAPVADAGPDQSIILIGSTIQLDGSQSYDPDGDVITYQWGFTSVPRESSAILENADTATPTFVADVKGEYVAQLIVSDASTQSTNDTVTISFENVKPIANAGTGRTVNIGETVTLDGSGSSDANGDSLTYKWTLTSVPAGSTSSIADATAMVTTFVPDIAETYVVQLVVNDGTVDSDPVTIQIQATTSQETVVDTIRDIEDQINLLDPSVFKNANMQKTFINKLNAVIANIDAGNYADALDQLQNDILKKTDGCAKAGAPDNNDWITNCAAQGQVYPFIIEAINLLKLL